MRLPALRPPRVAMSPQAVLIQRDRATRGRPTWASLRIFDPDTGYYAKFTYGKAALAIGGTWWGTSLSVATQVSVAAERRLRTFGEVPDDVTAPSSSLWRAFIRDWIVFAPLALWIAAILTPFLHENLVEGEIVNGALMTYAIAVTAAHVGDIDWSVWDRSRRRVRVLSVVLPNLFYLILILALCTITVGFVHKRFPKVTELGLSDAFTCLLGLTLAAIGLLIAVFTLITKRRLEVGEK